MFARALSFAIALASFAAPRPAAAADAAADTAALGRALDACVADAVRAGALSGQFLVARDGRVLLERCWGAADRTRRAPMTPTTRLCIASITKPFTQALAARLVREGRLSPADTLGRWLPGFPHGAITVRQLLAHASGIPHRVTTDAEEAQPLSAAEVTARAGRAPLAFAPGTGTLYSSAGYTVLAHVLERATGRTWDALVRERLLVPAKLERTVPSAGLADALPERATSYLAGATAEEAAPRKDLGFLAGAGSIWSTARDLERFSHAVLDGTCGDDVRAALAPQGRLEWSGSTNGFYAWLDHDPASGTTVVFLGNLQTGAAGILRFVVRGVLAGRDVKPIEVPHPAVVALPAEALRRCEGRYDVPGTGVVPLESRDGVLWADGRPLRPTSDSTFFCPTDWSRVALVPGADGGLAALDWTLGPRTVRCRRLGPLVHPGGSATGR